MLSVVRLLSAQSALRRLAAALRYRITQDGNSSQHCKVTEVFPCCDGGVMSQERSNFLDSTSSDLAQLPSPIEIINAMIEPRVQLYELEGCDLNLM